MRRKWREFLLWGFDLVFAIPRWWAEERHARQVVRERRKG